MKHVGRWPAAATALLVFLASTPKASEPLTLVGIARFESGQPVVGGNVIITEMKKRFLGRFRLPKVVRTLSVATKDDGTFRIELSDIRGHLDVSLEYEICQWTGAVAIVSEAEIASAESVQVELTTRSSSCENGTSN